MSGSAANPKKLGGILMCNNNGFCGGNFCWIILLIILFCNCGGGTNWLGNGNCGCDNNCGCC